MKLIQGQDGVVYGSAEIVMSCVKGISLLKHGLSIACVFRPPSTVGTNSYIYSFEVVEKIPSLPIRSPSKKYKNAKAKSQMHSISLVIYSFGQHTKCRENVSFNDR
jgi:hypothetical protein